jgi:hypothetical protein
VIRTTILGCLAVASGCVEGRLYAAAPVNALGVRAELAAARALPDRVEIALVVSNDRETPVTLLPDRLRLLGPDGVSRAPDAQTPATVPPHGTRTVALSFAHPVAALIDASGFWLGLAGLASDAAGPIVLPDMPLGHPLTPAPPPQ